MTIRLRAAAPADAEACGQIIYEAFGHVAGSHGFPTDFPALEAATGLAGALIANPEVYGIVAERDGVVVGSNFLNEGDEIRGVGPITVDPKVQGGGIGRRLMQAVVERANGAAGIRLLQDGFNMGSLALYASLGFEVREPVVVIAGQPSGEVPGDIAVRPMRDADLDACDALCRRVHGISRRRDLAGALQHLAPVVAERDGAIAAYMTAPGFWIANHGVAADEAGMRALILGAAVMGPLSFLMPMRQAALFRWCLEQGMRTVKPMTIMTIGKYRPAEGCYMPSVFY